MRLDFESNISPLTFAENGLSENSDVILSETKELLREGIKAAQAGSRASARTLLLRVTELDPRNENAWLWLASISEYPEELLVFLNNVLDINPHNERALEWTAATKSLLAKTFVQRGIDASKESQLDLSRQCFEQALKQEATNEMAWLWLASIADSPEEKRSHLDQLLSFSPSNEAALAALKSLQTQDSQKLLQKANQYAAAGQKQEAAETLAKVLGKSPELEDAWLLKSHLSDSFDEKLKCFERVLEINPQNVAAQSAVNSFKSLMQFNAPQVSVENAEVAPAPATEKAAAEEFAAEETSNFQPEETPVEENSNFTQSFSSADYFADEFQHNSNPTQDLELPQALIDENYFAAEREAEFQSRQNESAVDSSTDHSRESAEESAMESFPEDFLETSGKDFENQAVLNMSESDSHEMNASFGEESEENTSVSDVQPDFSDSAEQQFAAASNIEPENEAAFYEENESESQSVESLNTQAFEFPHYNSPKDGEQYFQTAAQEAENHDYQTPESFDFEEVLISETANQNPAENSSANYFETPTIPDNAAATEESFVEEDFSAVKNQEFTGEEQSPYLKSSVETADCPFCSSPNEVQAFACRSCCATLSISEMEMLLSNDEADKSIVQEAVSRMELEKNMRVFDAEELMQLGLGHFNLKNFRQGFSYFQESSQMNPNNVLLGSQLGAMAIRLAEIEQKGETEDAKPKGKVILVVDDSATVRKLISGKLEKSGHEVICAVDGMDALAKLDEMVPDMILLDITMPRMDGYQVCKLIRNNPVTKDIPIVMISGKDGFFDKVRGRMAGTTGYITKPFGPETLMKALEVYMKNGEVEEA